MTIPKREAWNKWYAKNRRKTLTYKHFYNTGPRGRLIKKAYRQLDYVKEREKEYNNLPRVKERKRLWAYNRYQEIRDQQPKKIISIDPIELYEKNKIKRAKCRLKNHIYNQREHIKAKARVKSKEFYHKKKQSCPEYFQDKKLYFHIWWMKNKDEQHIKHKIWVTNHKAQVQLLTRKTKTKRRLKLKSLSESEGISKQDQQKIIERDKNCAYCKHPFTKEHSYRFTVDHIIAINNGGNNKFNNLVGCCQTCNVLKSDKDVFQWCAQQDREVPQIVIKLLNEQREQKTMWREYDPTTAAIGMGLIIMLLSMIVGGFL